MKKLMFAMAALAAGSVFAATGGEIVSNNIVGFNNKPTENGFVLVAPSFTAVGGGEYNLADFKLGANAADDGSIQIQVLTDAGVNEQTYIWLGANMGYEPGWYDFDLWTQISATIKPGQGFLINIPSGGEAPDVTTAGEVALESKQVELPTGFTILGNTTPVDQNISKFTLADDAKSDGSIQIQVLTTAGVNEVTYVWLGEDMGMDPGWYDFGSWSAITVDIKAGEALLFNNPNDPTTLTIPAAL